MADTISVLNLRATQEPTKVQRLAVNKVRYPEDLALGHPDTL